MCVQGQWYLIHAHAQLNNNSLTTNPLADLQLSLSFFSSAKQTVTRWAICSTRSLSQLSLYFFSSAKQTVTRRAICSTRSSSTPQFFIHNPLPSLPSQQQEILVPQPSRALTTTSATMHTPQSPPSYGQQFTNVSRPRISTTAASRRRPRQPPQVQPPTSNQSITRPVCRQVMPHPYSKPTLLPWTRNLFNLGLLGEWLYRRLTLAVRVQICLSKRGQRSLWPFHSACS